MAALASWLDARAWNEGHGGRWLVRIEDLDTARNMPGAAALILRQLQELSLLPDEAATYQSQRIPRYQQAMDQLLAAGYAYPCGCSRKDIATALERLGHTRPRHGELVYPGTCRNGLQGKPALGWRFRTTTPDAAPHENTAAAAPPTRWTDRRLGPQSQDVPADVGDFIVRRADGPFAYQLAVVVDDAAQQVTHVVRGEDLADNTARQLLIYGALGLQAPRYLHTPLVLGDNGEKLSKQNGAAALDTQEPLRLLNRAAHTLGLPQQQTSVGDALATWVAAWRHLYNPVL